jgi:hypothetical protein
MISTRKLMRMARKWQRAAAIKRKWISFPNNNGNANYSGCCSSPVAEKGYFVVYTADQQRYSFPITYLNNYIFRELFRMAEEVFGLPSDGPITIPCDSTFMHYVISLIQRNATQDMEKALLMSIAACRYSSSYAGHQSESRQHHQLYCF